MGSTNDINLSDDSLLFRNCIRKKPNTGHLKVYEQYDSYGNIIFYYRQQPKTILENKILIFDSQGTEVGLIKKGYENNNEYYALFNENKELIMYIEYFIKQCGGSISINYTFFDSNKNITGKIVNKLECCCSEIFEEFDKFDNRIKVHRCIDKMYYCDYIENDSEGNRKFKIRKTLQNDSVIIKIYDSNDAEINLDDKSLFDDKFTKLQTILILRKIFRRK